MTEPTYGIILAGGMGRRMGGGDKTLRPLGGRSILSRIIERLSPQCAGLVLNANGAPERFAREGLPVTADSLPERAGPLAGVLAGLDWVSDNAPGVEWAVSLPGDTPFPPHDLVTRLHAARRLGGTPCACAASGSQPHWAVALWRVDLRDAVRDFLVHRELRKVRLFLEQHGVAQAVWPATPFDPFFNANTPEELEQAEDLATRLDHGTARDRLA